MAPSLVELNALLDNYIPLTKKVSDAKTAAMQKEAEALEKILARVWLVMRYIDTEGQAPYYRNKIDIIDRSEKAICDGLADMFKCNVTLDVEHEELQSRIERADSLMEIMNEKFVIECRQSESEVEEVRT